MEHVLSNNGVKTPMLGFGVFQIRDPKQCRQAVLDAIAAGCRLIDTAASYGNEEAIGEAIRFAVCQKGRRKCWGRKRQPGEKERRWFCWKSWCRQTTCFVELAAVNFSFIHERCTPLYLTDNSHPAGELETLLKTSNSTSGQLDLMLNC